MQRTRLDSPQGIYRSIAEKIELLRQQAIERAEDSVAFLRKALDLARTLVKAERLETEGRIDEAETLLDPNIGALTQIVDAFQPENAPVVVEDVARDIDTIVKQVRFTGWSKTHAGDREVRKQLRLVLQKYALPATGEPFDSAYAYVRENY